MRNVRTDKTSRFFFDFDSPYPFFDLNSVIGDEKWSRILAKFGFQVVSKDGSRFASNTCPDGHRHKFNDKAKNTKAIIAAIDYAIEARLPIVAHLLEVTEELQGQHGQVSQEVVEAALRSDVADWQKIRTTSFQKKENASARMTLRLDGRQMQINLPNALLKLLIGKERELAGKFKLEMVIYTPTDSFEHMDVLFRNVIVQKLYKSIVLIRSIANLQS